MSPTPLIHADRVLHAVAECRVDDTNLPHDERGPGDDSFKLVSARSAAICISLPRTRMKPPEVTTVAPPKTAVARHHRARAVALRPD